MTSNTSPDGALTLEQLYAALEACTVTYWYTTSIHVAPGQVLEVSPSQLPQAWNIAPPKYWIFHPDDFPFIQVASPPYVRWKHIRDWRKSPAQACN